MRRPHSAFIFALIISLLLHSWLLWVPEFALPFSPKHQMTHLSAKLEPLPIIAAMPAKTKAKVKSSKKPAPPAAVPNTEPAAETPIDNGEPKHEPETPTVSQPDPTETAVAEPLPEPPPAKPATRAPLPHFARLKFEVTVGNTGIKMGEAIHSLEIIDDHYTLSAKVHTTGIINLLKSFTLSQTSSGKASGETLFPERYEEHIVNSDKDVTRSAQFDREHQLIHYSDGSEAPLVEDTQDMLSVLYQFPTLIRNAEMISLPISTGKKFQQEDFELAVNEILETPMGKLTTVHFRRKKQAEREGIEIWFGQEYRYLPVKVVHYNRAGEVTAIATISEIEVAEN
jgi:hypothetical protein